MGRVVLLALLLLAVLPSFAAPAGHYASSSRMASGKWVKISVKETGMQFLSNSFLRNQGFTDPSKVNVYGYGGRIISEVLNDTHPDDLVLAPAIHTDAGILFFGTDHALWSLSTGAFGYEHELNPYASGSFYFLSDCDGAAADITLSQAYAGNAVEGASSFRELLYYEQNLAAPSNTGRTLLGEDFRTQTSRQFPFSLPDNQGNVATAIKFATNTTNGSSSIMVKANGKDLPATTSDTFAAVPNSETFMRTNTSVKNVDIGTDEKLTLEIKYTGGGAIAMARLDWIEVAYDRALKLADNELHFRFQISYPTKYRLGNATAATQVWDVTDPRSPYSIPVGADGSFVCAQTGWREFVAFNPSATFRSPAAAGTVSNQDIHSLPVPDMLIISPKEYLEPAERLAQMHRDDDAMVVYVLTPEQIYNEFSSGTPDVSAFRKCLKMWHDRGLEGNEGTTLKYCLIYSKPTYDNAMLTDVVKRAGYPRVPIWQSKTGTSQNTSYSTDAFIAMLDDVAADFKIGQTPLSIGVGRLPVKSLQEASDATDKIIEYARNPILGAWRNEVMIIADDQDSNVHFNQAQSGYGYMRQSDKGSSVLYNRLYLDAYPLESTATGQTYVIPNKKLKKAFDDGVMYMVYIGHASPREWGHEGLLTWTDMTNLSNRKLPFIYAATCEFARWDDDTPSGAEEMWLYPSSGAIGFFTAARSVYISNNGNLTNAMSKVVFQGDGEGKGKRLGDIFRESLNGVNGTDDNKLRYLLMGDPALRLPLADYAVTVTEIGDVDISSVADADLPQVPAKGKVRIKGQILNPEGVKAETFNGTVEISLYDAERVVETLGNGTSGESVMYNDHVNRLVFTRAQAVAGEWETVLMLPSEIDNNYSPALLSLYAYSTDGIEANGASEKLYVYGYDTEGDNDLTGPEILSFYLNTPSFKDGDVVAQSAVAYASFADESGINISESGIGHALSLIVDGKTHYTDVASAFEPDPEEPGKGSMAYMISGLEPGEHTLELVAWDNANNSTHALLTFRVSASSTPNLVDITTNVNPASTSVTFLLTHDRPGEQLSSRIEVFDLSGKKVWQGDASSSTGGMDSDVRMTWNLADGNGERVPRGIYLYRATIETSQGRTATKTKKLAVTAPR